MKALLIAGAACSLAAVLSGCSTTNSQAMQPVIQALASGLPRCNISGSINSGVGGLAGTGTGMAQNFTFNCPADPNAALAAPTSAASK